MACEEFSKNSTLGPFYGHFSEFSSPQGGGGVHHKVGFCSFPRSGSSFLRRLIENCSGIVTGSSISLHTATGL